MNGILKYTHHLSSLGWELLKYIRRLAFIICLLFTAAFWIAGPIALRYGLIYRSRFFILGIGMTLITLAAVIATVFCHFFDLRRQGVLIAFLILEAAIMLLWPMFHLYRIVFYGYSVQEGKYGNIQITTDDYPGPVRYYDARVEAVFFMRILNWDTENTRYTLSQKYMRDFSNITCNDGIIRYVNNDHPEIKVRVYDSGKWKTWAIEDDYIQKLERKLFLNCYRKEGMDWEYVLGKNDDLREGEIYFVIKENDDLVQYSKDISKMIDAALSEYLFDEFEGSITVKYETKDTTDAGVTFKFGGNDLEQPQYYTDWRHVLKVLENGK